MTKNKKSEKQPTLEKAHCPKCGPQINTEIHGELTFFEDYEDGEFWSEFRHTLNRCRGCETVFYVKRELFSENIYEYHSPFEETKYEAKYSFTSYPPIKSKPEPAWVSKLEDTQLLEILSEIYEAFEAGLSMLVTIGLRTAFERASTMLGAQPESRFAEKTKYLVDNGHITPKHKGNIDKLVTSGNASAHQAWKPNSKDLLKLLETLEHFLVSTVAPTPDLSNLTIPQKKPKSKKAPSKPGKK